MKEPRSTALQSLLSRVGVVAFLLLLGVVLALLGLHSLGWVNAWDFPLKAVAAFLIGGGSACLLASRISRARLKQFVIGSVLLLVILVNAIAFAGAYAMTHFATPGEFPLGMPRPINVSTPADFGMDYETQTISINGHEWLEAWSIPSTNARGTVLLFPGNGGSKGKQLLAPAQIFHELSYNVLLVDFRGVGGSSGNTTTIGMREATDVALAMNYAESLNLPSPFILYGVSMGTAAILRAVAQESVQADALVLELPFVRLLDSVKSRLNARGIPSFPIAELLLLWGRLLHGFNGFSHNPVEDAKQVTIPTLIFQGEGDRWISDREINEILQNFQGPKQLVLFPNAGHGLLVTFDRELWTRSVSVFLAKVRD